MKKTILVILIVLLFSFMASVMAKGWAAMSLDTVHVCEQGRTQKPNPASAATTPELIQCIRNSDIEWGQSYAGLVPIRVSGATLALQDVGKEIEPLLLDALVEEDKFVAAHFLLTIRAQDEFPTEVDNWNGLQVQFSPSGEISYEGNNLLDLQMRWRERLGQ